MTIPANDKIIDFDLIDTADALEKLTVRLKSVQTIAFDTEADSFHHYRPKVCLMQICFEGYTAIVDPLAPMAMEPFLEELAKKELIIHDAGYDLRMLKGDFDFVPQNGVFDTMLASALTGMANVGLSSVLEHVLDMKVAKHNQKADWSRRPLPKHLLRYAAEDTLYLMQVRQHLESRLKELGRLEWHAESCRQAVEAATAAKEPPDSQQLWRIKGTGKLSHRQMAFVREIWHWRQDIAKRTNIAPFMICRNEEIVKLALWAAHRRKSIELNTELPIRCKKPYRPALIAALVKAQGLPQDQWPNRRPSDPSKKLTDATRRIVNALKAECEKIAHEQGLAMQWIASRSALTQIVTAHAITPEQILKKKILLNWQVRLILPAIRKILPEAGNNS
jgi:ribonuclease D